MGSVGAPLSLNNGGSTTANTLPHYLQPSSGSCHDICKYGRRRAFEDSTTHSIALNKPSPAAKNNSNPPTKRRWSLSQNVKRGSVVLPPNVPLQGQESKSVGRKISAKLVKPSVRPKPVTTSDGKGRRNSSDVASGRNGRRLSMPAPKKAWVPLGTPLSPKGRQTSRVELKDRRKALKSISVLPSSSSKAEEDQEIKKNEFESTTNSCNEVVSDTTTVSQRMRKRQVVVRRGDKQSVAVRLNFRTGKQMHLHKINNAPTSLKLRSTRQKEYDSVSDCNSSPWIGSPMNLRSVDRHGAKAASKSRSRRIRYGKARVLVLEDRMRGKNDKVDAAGAEFLLIKKNLNHQDIQMKTDVECLFNHVIDETASKLAERRKGMVKSLVGAFEMLISLQTRNCFLHVRVAS